MGNKYVIVTPVKNEEVHFKPTIQSVINQELKPSKWVIINDGSTDGTKELIDNLAKEYDWIHPVHSEPQEFRKPGGEFVLAKGFGVINVKDYDFIVKMDGDLSFKEEFFKKIFEEFDKNPKLGIASGVCYVKEGDSMVEEKHPVVHTRGPLKTYRTQCFIDIKGIEPELGWDTIDEMRANMLGWKTSTIPHLKIHHLRKTQTAQGVLNGVRNVAAASYYTGYHPLFLIMRGIKNMKQKPYIIGGAFLIFEYFKNYFRRKPKVNDPALIKYIRKNQLNKLLGRETIWN